MKKEPKKRALDIAVELAGNKAALAKLVGVVPQTVSWWIKKGKVPATQVIAVSKALKNKITVKKLLFD